MQGELCHIGLKNHPIKTFHFAMSHLLQSNIKKKAICLGS